MPADIWSYVSVYDLQTYDDLFVYDTHIWVFRHMIPIYGYISRWDEADKEESVHPRKAVKQRKRKRTPKTTDKEKTRTPKTKVKLHLSMGEDDVEAARNEPKQILEQEGRLGERE